jgi:hypothetical protein
VVAACVAVAAGGEVACVAVVAGGDVACVAVVAGGEDAVCVVKEVVACEVVADVIGVKVLSAEVKATLIATKMNVLHVRKHKQP